MWGACSARSVSPRGGCWWVEGARIVWRCRGSWQKETEHNRISVCTRSKLEHWPIIVMATLRVNVPCRWLREGKRVGVMWIYLWYPLCAIRLVIIMFYWFTAEMVYCALGLDTCDFGACPYLSTFTNGFVEFLAKSCSPLLLTNLTHTHFPIVPPCWCRLLLLKHFRSRLLGTKCKFKILS